MRYVLILDIGTGGVHTCLADANGILTANAYEEIRYVFNPEDKGYELDALEMFDAVRRQIKATLAKAGVGGDAVRAIGVTSQRPVNVILDRDDRPLMAFQTRDGRSQLLCEEMSHDDSVAVFDATARWPACWFPAPRILWAKRQKEELHRNIAGLLMLNEYAAFRLTGNKVSEWTNAVETMLFDIHSRTWSGDLITMFGAENIALSPIVETGESAGLLSAELAAEFGIARVPVVMTASDTQSATLGCGDIGPGDAVAVNGSTTPVFAPTETMCIDRDRRRVYTSPYYGGMWALEGNCTMSGIVHRKLMDQLLHLARCFPGQEKLERSALYDLLARNDADPEGVTMHWGPVVANIGSTTRLARLSLYADNDERNIFMSIITAFVENLAFAIHENARQLGEIGDRPLDRIFLTGGGSASVRLQKALAALNPDKAVYLTNELETTSRGAAIQAWMAVGEFSDLHQAYEAMNEKTWVTPLRADPDERLAARHARWREELTE
ncbi:MAG: FGGY-family carbohydrate kinase [Planctomycetes bacterium]|nr:FGGY-family carbohydrate kinase [Planctomycetota bacterium]